MFSSSLHLYDCYSFSCLIAMTRISDALVNRSGVSGHPSHVPEFIGKTFSFSSLSMMLVVDLS